MTKKITAVNIDERTLELSRKFRINRSQVAEKAINLAIALKMKTLSVDIEDLVTLAAIHLSEEKRDADNLDLLYQKVEQEKYAKQREIEKKAETDQKLMAEYLVFCSLHKLDRHEYAQCLWGQVNIQNWQELEKDLSQHLIANNLTGDINRLRELLKPLTQKTLMVM